MRPLASVKLLQSSFRVESTQFPFLRKHCLVSFDRASSCVCGTRVWRAADHAAPLKPSLRYNGHHPSTHTACERFRNRGSLGDHQLVCMAGYTRPWLSSRRTELTGVAAWSSGSSSSIPAVAGNSCRWFRCSYKVRAGLWCTGRRVLSLKPRHTSSNVPNTAVGACI